MSEGRRVVILGGGFGELSAARHLNSNLVDVTLTTGETDFTKNLPEEHGGREMKTREAANRAD